MHLRTPSLSRRQFLASASLAAGGALFTACGKKNAPNASASGSGDQPFKGQTLRIFTYSGPNEKSLRTLFIPDFEAKTGAKVIVDPGWWDSIPKLKASPPGQPAFDLVLTDATQGFHAVRDGMFQKLDMSKIPNRVGLAPTAIDNWVYKEEYGITFPDSPMTLAYNKTLLDSAPANWGDLLKDNFNGKLGMYNSFYMSLYTFACMKAAADNAPGTAAKLVRENLQGVFDFAKANRDRVKVWYTTSTDMVQNLSRKNCFLGNISGAGLGPALHLNTDLAGVVPETDRGCTLLMYVIPVGSKVVDLAHEAINELMSEKVQVAFGRMGLNVMLPSVAKQIAAEDKIWASIFPHTDAHFAGAQYYPYDAYMDHWDDIVKMWDREVLRKSA